MMTGIRGASNAKANRELAWNPAHPNWREGFRGIDEQVATIVFATPAVSKWIEDRTGWSIKRFVCTARRYRTIEIQAGNHIITAADPLPRDLDEALGHIHRDPAAH
jgi:phosphoglycolate phosphatase-like HAD superfamily hydrolase